MLNGKNRHIKFMELLAKRMQGKGDMFPKMVDQQEVNEKDAE